MTRQDRRRREREGRPQVDTEDDGSIPLHDMELARERYFDIARKHNLSAEDIHAIMVGSAIDALTGKMMKDFPDVPNRGALAHADFERVRRAFENEPDVLANATLYGYIFLVATASFDPKQKPRLPP